MLTHKVHKSAVAVANYFRDHLAPGRTSTGEYLSDAAAEPAVWRGDVARHLGIEGQVVSEDGFLAATLGRKPVNLPENFSSSDEVRAFLEARPLEPDAAAENLAVVLPDGTQGTIGEVSEDRQTAWVRRQGRRTAEEVPLEKLRVRGTGSQSPWRPEDRLTQRQTKDVGFDITLSVPKGFSLLLNAGDERLDGAFDRAVDRLMARVEDEAYVRVRGEGRGADDRQRSSSLLWTAFKHETSRPVRQQDGTWHTDPHRHAHVFVFNTTRSAHDAEAGDDGQLYALFARPIHERFRYYEAVFDNLLTEELQTSGYAVHRRGESFEIDGVTPAMVRAFSERTKEINQFAAEQGLSAEQKASAGWYLRESKDEAKIDDMRAHMAERKPQFVARLDRIADAARSSAVSASKLAPAGQRKAAGDAVDAAINAAVERGLERGLERKSTTYFDRFMRDALIHAAGRASEQEILSAVREREGLFVELNKAGDRYNITTREILEDEKGLVFAMKRSRGTVQPLAEFVDKCERLNEQQQQALEHVLFSKDRVTSIKGRPGVGKSWVIEDLNRELQDRGVSVVALAPTVAASRGALRAAKLENANTLAAFLDGRGKEAKALQSDARAGVIVLDEAGMAGTTELRRLLEKAEHLGARVVCIGDTDQLGTVARGDGLRLMEKHGLQAADINEIQRQQDETYKRDRRSLQLG